MPRKTKIDPQIDLVQTMRELVQTYEEVYVLKMQRIRKSVVDTRYFVDGVSDTFNDIKTAYRQDLIAKGKIVKSTDKLSLSSSEKKQQTIAVLLSASEKLAGEINQKVFSSFWQYLEKHPQTQIVIAGRTGKKFYEQKITQRPFRYFDLPEEALSIEDLRPIINYLIQFEDVNVFYGKFNSFVNQQSTLSNITGEQFNTDDSTSRATEHIRSFLFEPSPQELLTFFETQIFTSLFKQTVHESYLAQVGSRIMVLEAASGNILKQLNKLKITQRKFRRRINNRKQLQALVGISFWG